MCLMGCREYESLKPCVKDSTLHVSKVLPKGVQRFELKHNKTHPEAHNQIAVNFRFWQEIRWKVCRVVGTR
jgi:hypothetical protein